MTRKTLFFVSIPLIAALAGCSGGSSSRGGSGSTDIFSTGGGSLTTGTGSITVTVRDLCSGEALSNAYVWIDSDTANAVLTNASGLATINNVAGQAGDRLISAGKADYSLASVLTSATNASLGLIRTDRTGGSQTTTISGTVTFQGVQSSAQVWVVDQADCEAGFSSDTAINSGGTGSYSLTVPVDRAVVVAVATYDGDGTLTALSFSQVSALTVSGLSGLNFTLSADRTPITLTQGTVSGINTSHDNGGVSGGTEVLCGGLGWESHPLSTASTSQILSTFQAPNDTIAATLNLMGTHGIEAYTSSVTGQSTWVSESFSMNSLNFPSLTLPAGTVSVSVNHSGDTVRPTVTWTTTLTSTSGFHAVTFQDVVSNNKYRCWLFLTAGNDTSFDVPAVPAALADDALVVSRSYGVDVEAVLTTVSSFDNFSPDMGGDSRGFGDETSYTP